MLALAMVLLSSALSTTPAAPAPDAVIRFDSDSPLRGISYGLDAVDGQRLILGQRTTAHVAPGLRTIEYSCPDAPLASGGNRLTFAFEADQVYALQCRAGQPVVIRASGC
jgi:hypothetical protein